MQVLQLVDPSLFPLVRGVSRALPLGTGPAGQAEAVQPAFTDWKNCMGMGQPVNVLVAEDDPVYRTDEKVFISERFQWLPSDVAIGVDGSITLLSYINNMHPEWHSQLYRCTAALLERSIPLFERVLATAAAGKPRAITPPEDNGVRLYAADMMLSAT